MPEAIGDNGNGFEKSTCTKGQRAVASRPSVQENNSRLILEDGAGFGDVSVKRFDDGGVLLFDNAALDLERESEAAVVESKIFGEKSEAFDGFVLREMDGETFDFCVNQRPHPGMGGQFGVGGKLDSLVGSFSSYRGGIGDDERNDEF